MSRRGDSDAGGPRRQDEEMLVERSDAPGSDRPVVEGAGGARARSRPRADRPPPDLRRTIAVPARARREASARAAAAVRQSPHAGRGRRAPGPARDLRPGTAPPPLRDDLPP